MNALCRAYENTADAERAVEALLGAGVAGDDVRLLMGAEIHDARRESGGGFAGEVASDARVGAFGGAAAERATPRSSFAGDVSGGEGVFSNADRDVVISYSDGREHGRVAEADVRALHEGRVLVLVTLGAVSEDRAADLLDATAAA